MPITEVWSPSGPYIFKSGKRIGRSVEAMMFTDYSLINWMRNKRIAAGGLPDALHRHLNWIFKRDEELQAPNICSFCQARPVRLFSARGDSSFGYSMGSEYVCCADRDCIAALSKGDPKVRIVPLKFSSTLHFSLRSDQRQVGELLKGIFLPDMGRLNPQRIFELFRSMSAVATPTE